jgi:cytosine/adenosine deaminase-related metal-dependent hydrolase
VDLATAVEMATVNPLRLLGKCGGGLRPGDRADLVLFHWQDGAQALDVTATIAGGAVVFGNPAAV